MRKILIVFTVLLLCTPVVLAEDSFFDRLRNFFGSEQRPEPAGCPFKENLCYTSEGKILCSDSFDSCVRQHGRCRCGAVEEFRELPEEIPEEISELLEPIRACNPCDVVVCSAQATLAYEEQFICPSSLEICQKRFGNGCKQLDCYKKSCRERTHLCIDEGVRVKCEGSYEQCAKRYIEGCSCGIPEEKCKEKVHTCYPRSYDKEQREYYGGSEGGSAPEQVTDAIAIYPQSVLCEGGYDDCVERHGRCTCGVIRDDFCEYNGEKHRPGTSFPSNDGCNTCFCNDNGDISCTERACAECRVDRDCPDIACITDPCPQYQCIGGRCLLGMCGDGVCQSHEERCVEACPNCVEGTPPEDCQCVKHCQTTCPADCERLSDLAPVGVDWSPAPHQGARFEEVVFKIHNYGPGDFDGVFGIEFRIHRDGEYFYEAGSSSHRPLEAGESEAYTFTSLLDRMPDLIPGTYTVEVEVDENEIVDEENEHNNVLTEKFEIVRIEDYCIYDDIAYKVGDSFPSTDGCNTCFCDVSGRIACTQRYCADR